MLNTGFTYPLQNLYESYVKEKAIWLNIVKTPNSSAKCN